MTDNRWMRGAIAGLIFLSISLAWQAAAKDAPYPVPAPPADTSNFGENFQRTMTLLATSGPDRHHRVKILFYGQSIAGGTWWNEVAADLRRRFPHADLEIVNRAIGGFSAQKLYRVAEHDVYPYYPDLILFHVYGAHTVYEDLIAEMRTRTAAEIAIWTDHLGAREKPGFFGAYRDRGWPRFMAGFVPAVAVEYQCGLIEIRKSWKQYVVVNDLGAQDLLLDDIHLNEQGGYLMAELVKRQLVHRPDLALGASADLVKDYEVGRDVTWHDGRLELPFSGNRIDLIPAAGATDRDAVEVRVDGVRPSEFAGTYAHTRPSEAFAMHGPGILRVGFEKRPLIEDWLARITHVDAETGIFRFEVIGSRTGLDGVGASDEDFVSNSGRVTIAAHVQPRGVPEQSDWRMVGDIPVAYEIRWTTIGMFQDRYAPPIVVDETREHAATVVQGIPNGEHVLVLSSSSDGPAGIRAIRVYRPPFRR